MEFILGRRKLKCNAGESVVYMRQPHLMQIEFSGGLAEETDRSSKDDMSAGGVAPGRVIGETVPEIPTYLYEVEC